MLQEDPGKDQGVGLSGEQRMSMIAKHPLPWRICVLGYGRDIIASGCGCIIRGGHGSRIF